MLLQRSLSRPETEFGPIRASVGVLQTVIVDNGGRGFGLLLATAGRLGRRRLQTPSSYEDLHFGLIE